MDALNSLISLSKSVAKAPELTQGGGGNTSVKSGEEMYIKASGFRLDEVNNTGGFVKVKHLPVKIFLHQNTSDIHAPDVTLKHFVNEQIIGDKAYLPSMETGFHAVLKNFVIHTHPVMVNQIMCCKGGEEKMQKIFGDEKITVLPILNPGYYLSKAVADTGEISSIIFLQNHGLIVHGDNEQSVINLHAGVIKKINEASDYKNEFHFELIKTSEDLHELRSGLLEIYFSQPGLLSLTYFPDQAVVIGNNLEFAANDTIQRKLHFNTKDKKCFIKGNYKNALAIAENLVALANIVEYANKQKVELQALRDEDVAYILGMDMEKYRQGLLK